MNKPLRIALLVIADIISINLAFYLAIFLRFDGMTGQGADYENHMKVFSNHWIFMTLIGLAVFYFFRLYKSVWRYASIGELIQVIMALFVNTALLVSYFMATQVFVARSIYIFYGILAMIFVGGFRFSYRLLRRIRNHELFSNAPYTRVMIIGAGDAGAVVIRELKNSNKLNSKPVAIIDDDKSKEGTAIFQVPVVGQRKDIVMVAEKMRIDEIIIAMPSASKQAVREIVEECKKTKCSLKTLPGIYELIDGKIDVNAIRNVRIEDLLGREVIDLNTKEIGEYITGKKVLITGGGGSIGSELARQIALFKPKELILLDIYENNVYDLQNELKRKYKINDHDHGYSCDDNEDFCLRVIIASVRDRDRMEEIMQEVQPDIVFHAAAHKHVPLMEHNPKEAIKNNIFGTFNVAQAACKSQVKRFVMISTDKAVNPTNIMGATKRMCEMIIQSLDKTSTTEFALVRFGNVLGSNGSVVPLFERQIAEQGYITVTHPEIIRYFMTIPEAARLVIQAGAMAKGGEIFILDMGEPVKILDLAKDIIRLSGLEPDVDIPIRITGLRPGEKLYEELLLKEEGIQSTRHQKIFIGKPIDIEYNKLLTSLDALKKALKDNTDEEIKIIMQELVPTYKPDLSEQTIRRTFL